jgi:hypothetical protein
VQGAICAKQRDIVLVEWSNAAPVGDSNVSAAKQPISITHCLLEVSFRRSRVLGHLSKPGNQLTTLANESALGGRKTLVAACESFHDRFYVIKLK